MVSRSLEKMLLIAIGLSTAVIVGVPVLFHAIDILGSASRLEAAHAFANRVHNLTAEVDIGQANDTTVEIIVPHDVIISTNDKTLNIALMTEGAQETLWSETYEHEMKLIPPEISGTHLVNVKLIGNIIKITFTVLH